MFSVMVAEDTKTSQILIRALFQKLGMSPVIVDNGRDAVDMFSQRDFDLILMDLHMPGMGGIEAVERIRAIGDRMQPLIIGLTADMFPDTLEMCRRVGMDDVLSKPFGRQQIDAVLQQLKERRERVR